MTRDEASDDAGPSSLAERLGRSGEDARFTVVVVAAGAGVRMGGTPKVWRLVEGRPIWWWSLEAFRGLADRAVVVVASDWLEAARPLAASWPAAVAVGGMTRADSVRSGLSQVSTPLVAVHDGARPMVGRSLIHRVWDEAARFGAAIPGVMPPDTVKAVERGTVAATLPRAELVLAQTPQMFRTEWLRHALRTGESPTDDSAALEALGYPVHVVPGDLDNRKLTVEEDWHWLLSRWTRR